MKAFHVVAGLPRAGSTLLCNILNQNPAVYASSTSHLPLALASMTSVHSHSAEIKASSINDRDGTLTAGDVDRLIEFRRDKIKSIDKQIARLEKQRGDQETALEIEEATKVAIDSGGNFTED